MTMTLRLSTYSDVARTRVHGARDWLNKRQENPSAAADGGSECSDFMSAIGATRIMTPLREPDLT